MTYYYNGETYDETDYARDLYLAEHSGSTYEGAEAELRARHYSHGRNPLNPYPDKSDQSELWRGMITAVFQTIGIIILIILAIVVFTKIF